MCSLRAAIVGLAPFAVDVHSCGDEFTDVKFLSKLQKIVNTCSTSVSLSALYCCGEVLWQCVSLLC